MADPRRRRLTWIPRDLWSERIGDRINEAFRLGVMPDCLAEAGFPCRGLLVLRRGATMAALDAVEVVVPVSEPMAFWVAVEQMTSVNVARKMVAFAPPAERLSGERIHQWLGARYTLHGIGSDLARVRRQIVLVRALLEQQADFRTVLRDPERYRIVGDDPLPVLAGVTSDWEMRVVRVRSADRNGRPVLVAMTRAERWAALAKRWLGRRAVAGFVTGSATPQLTRRGTPSSGGRASPTATFSRGEKAGVDTGGPPADR